MTAVCGSGVAQSPLPHYKLVDRGPSFVRTLVNTPGLDAKGDLAIWHAREPGLAQGVVYTRTVTMELAGTTEYPMVYPSDLNDDLEVVGSLQSPQDQRFTQAFAWSKGKLDVLGTLGGRYGSASAVNQRGEIAGSSQTADQTLHAVLWHETRIRDLGLAAGGDYSSAHDINDRGEIVGEANSAPSGKPSGFLWSGDTLHLLPKLAGGTFCVAQALNNQSEIVGSCDAANGTNNAVLWRHGALTALGTLGDDDSTSTALDINAHTQIVGSSEIEDGKLRAFLWKEGHMLNLNQCVDANSGWLLLVASRINDRGEIAGRGFYRGAIHAFLLEPDLGLHATRLKN